MRISDWSSDVCSSDLVDFGLISRQGRHALAYGLLQRRRGGSFAKPEWCRRWAIWFLRGNAVGRDIRLGRAYAYLHQVAVFVPSKKRGGHGVQHFVGQYAEIGRASCRERGCQYG